jgi:hypothetical protein
MITNNFDFLMGRIDALWDAIKEQREMIKAIEREQEHVYWCYQQTNDRLTELNQYLSGLTDRVDAIDDCMDDRIVEIEEIKRALEAKAGVDKESRFTRRSRIPNTDEWRGLAEIVVFIGDEAYQAKRDHAPYRNRIPLADDKGILHEEAYGSYVRLLWESADRTESKLIGFVEKIGYVVLDPQYVPNRYCYAYRATTNFPFGPDRTFEDRVFVNNDHESYELARDWVIAKWEARQANETKHE